ncbi:MULTISPECIES: alpha/beta fold hydrolase [unclassified Pseudomonas]|uniref:alpha/beta fold hydrolase n=1 Tax=unclassified Pseudomonas TaxID=196821 RepID=UPI002AC9CF43|nr:MULTISPECIES: alpha/beta fold hydrolase [unclassified Pseudomonas]MEB0045875.1 alpha/beta fold hydrolase [Pseudomonas sp. Dout3]MEB0097135.1 alpha/beta fold hydrolase [Pseudomonas sp. DC1.2]WPX56928.1 alpha/beta fold hydrolase [Pseudomonas sp. DC1.2]
MLVLVVAIAVFVAWSWLSYPTIGQWLYDVSMATEAKLYRLHKIVVPISEMTVSTWQGGPYEAASSVLMLHGYSADKNIWLRFARHFVSDYRVIIPDLAGHGETGFKAGGGYDIALQSKRMIQLLDVCGVEKVHVIGNSMGGYIAAWLAATYPDRVASVTLIDPAGVTAPELSDLAQQLNKGHNPFLIHSKEEFRHFYAMTMANPPWVPGVVLDAVAQRYEQRREALAEIFTDFHASPPMEPKLADIRCPALLLWGRKDRLIDVSSVSVWSKGIADLRVEIWDHIGHMPMVEQPVRAARLCQAFLGKKH